MKLFLISLSIIILAGGSLKAQNCCIVSQDPPQQLSATIFTGEEYRFHSSLKAGLLQSGTPIEENSRTVHLSYQPKPRKKGGIARGVIIGACIGVLPVFVGLAIGEGQGGGFVTIATLPAGILIGGIVGAIVRHSYNRKHRVQNDKSQL